jgi:hypothetical protein
LLHAVGRTALYDIIFDGLIMVSRGRYDKKALRVVTDRMDNSSSRSLDQVVAQARRQGVLIYSIGIGDPNIGATSLAILFGELERVDARTLQMLSNVLWSKDLYRPQSWRWGVAPPSDRIDQQRTAPAIHRRIYFSRSGAHRLRWKYRAIPTLRCGCAKA